MFASDRQAATAGHRVLEILGSDESGAVVVMEAMLHIALAHTR
jgi:5-methylthioribose kinase